MTCSSVCDLVRTSDTIEAIHYGEFKSKLCRLDSYLALSLTYTIHMPTVAHNFAVTVVAIEKLAGIPTM